jgi:hypothetical protein
MYTKMAFEFNNKIVNDQLILNQSGVSNLTQIIEKASSSFFLFFFYRIYSTQLEARINDMIEVIAEILRGPVFLAGETLHCQITFTNKFLDENDPTNSK